MKKAGTMLTSCTAEMQPPLLESPQSMQRREMGVPKSAVYVGIRPLVITSMS